MDDRTHTSTTAKAVLAGAGVLLLALAARDEFGDAGVLAVLIAAMVALAVFAYAELTERPLPRLALRSREPEAPPVVEDVWRSERWIGEAVERGLRALDEWRLEHREA